MSPTLLAAAQRHSPHTAIILGSGLGQIADRVRADVSLPFQDCPPLAATHVDGHPGRVILGAWRGERVLILAGRNHFYEGHARCVVLEPVRLAVHLGVRRLLITNAAGGIRADLTPGTLMAITGHLNWAVAEPCRATIQTGGYAREWLERARHAAQSLGTSLATGVYAAVTGPNYETPAEIRALRQLGADAVGMSTAREVEEAHRLGLSCLAISCITNRAAGLSPSPLSHAEVLANSRQQANRLGDLIDRFLTA
jgi:purine-nucleoside phosphorylase